MLEVLRRTLDKHDRTEIVNALARLEDARAVSELQRRYRDEYDEVRWFTLKALGYIATIEAMAIVRDKGLRDESKACRALAEDLLDLSQLAQGSAEDNH